MLCLSQIKTHPKFTTRPDINNNIKIIFQTTSVEDPFASRRETI